MTSTTNENTPGTNPLFKVGEEVELRITDETDLGFKAVINSVDEGLLYHNEIFEPLKTDEIKRGYIKNLREDGKIDLSL